MVRNMERYEALEQLKRKIELIFERLKINYELLDLEDEDINYDIEFNANGKYKAVGRINGILYFHHNDYSLNLIISNIYRLKESDNLSFFYELINNLNINFTYGKFYVLTDKTQIIYRSNVSCGENYLLLNESLLQTHLDIFIDALEILFESIRSKNNE